MPRLWRQIIKGEEGQALPIVLILLVVGGLIIAPTLNHVSTSLNAGIIVEENVRGIYAAEAGVEDVLWKLINDPSPPSSPYYLPESVNQMQQVEIETGDKGPYALYDGGLIKIGEHPQNFPGYLAVDREVWNVDVGGGIYKYIITVTWQEDEPSIPTVIHLVEIGVRIPVGFSYQSDSADIEGNLSKEEPVGTLDDVGAHLLNWALPPPSPDVSVEDPTATQTFYVTGTGDPEGDYVWVECLQDAVGQLGGTIGVVYQITATATSDSGHNTTVEAYVMISSIDYTAIVGSFILEGGHIYYDNVDAEGGVQLDEGATLNGNAIARTDVHLDSNAIINGDACAGTDVYLDQNAIINGDVYAEGNVTLEPGAIINGDVYNDGTVTDPSGGITGAEFPYTGCGLSLTGNRLEILNWEID